MRNFPPSPWLHAAAPITRLVLALVFLLAAVGLGIPHATTAAALPAQTGLTMTSRSRSALAVSWKPVANATSYKVRWSTSSRMKSAKSKAAYSASAELSGLKYHKGYYVQVRALDKNGAALTAYNKAKKMWTLSKSGFKVLPPSGLSATPVDSNYLKLTFSARSGAAKYLVRYSKSASFNPVDRLAVTSTTVLIPALQSSTSYYISVRAVTSSGSSMSYYSPSIKATTGAAHQSTVGKGSDPTRQVRLASYNVKCYGCAGDGGASWGQRRDAVIGQIAEQHPDVIGLQEASQGQMKNSTLSQFEDIQMGLVKRGSPYRLANAYRYNCKTSTSSSSCSYVYRGASQASRIIYNADELKLVDAGSIQLAYVSRSDNERFLAWAVFEQISSGKSFVFGTAHLQPNASGSSSTYDSRYTPMREKQAGQVRAKLAGVAAANGGIPMVVTGDFNSRWTSVGKDGKRYNGPYKVFRDAGFYDPLNGGSEADRLLGPTISSNALTNEDYNSCNGYTPVAPRTASGKVGTNVDYILMSRSITATAWETVVRVDSEDRFIGVIPSDHNLIRADVRLP